MKQQENQQLYNPTSSSPQDPQDQSQVPQRPRKKMNINTQSFLGNKIQIEHEQGRQNIVKNNFTPISEIEPQAGQNLSFVHDQTIHLQENSLKEQNTANLLNQINENIKVQQVENQDLQLQINKSPFNVMELINNQKSTLKLTKKSKNNEKQNQPQQENQNLSIWGQIKKAEKNQKNKIEKLIETLEKDQEKISENKQQYEKQQQIQMETHEQNQQKLKLIQENQQQKQFQLTQTNVVYESNDHQIFESLNINQNIKKDQLKTKETKTKKNLETDVQINPEQNLKKKVEKQEKKLLKPKQQHFNFQDQKQQQDLQLNEQFQQQSEIYCQNITENQISFKEQDISEKQQNDQFVIQKQIIKEKLQLNLTYELLMLIKKKVNLPFQDLSQEFFQIIDRHHVLYKGKIEYKDEKKEKDDFWQKKPINPKQQQLQIEAQKIKQMLEAALQSEGDKKLIREIKYQMNLLTAENFEKIIVIIHGLAKQENGLNKVVSAIIEKAWIEKKFAKIYANLCYNLQNKEDFQTVEEHNGKKVKKNLFKNILLQKIQETFEGTYDVMMTINSKIFSYEELSKEEKVKYDEMKKQKILGNMNFIGELFLSKVIQVQVINIINRTKVNQFLNDLQAYQILKQEESKNFEDHLEGIIVLNSKIGLMMEEKKTQKECEKILEAKELNELFKVMKQIQQNILKNNQNTILIQTQYFTFNGLFEIIKEIKNTMNIQKRFICLTDNILQKRSENWIESVNIEQGPKTMDQIYEDHINRQKKQAQEEKKDKKDIQEKKSIKQIQKYEKPFKEKELQKPQQKPQTLEKQKLNDQELHDKLNQDYQNFSKKYIKVKLEGSEEQKIQDYSAEDFYLEQTKNIKSSNEKAYLIQYFQTFFNEKKSIVEERIFIIKRLHQDKYIQTQNFLEEFNNFMKKFHTIAIDFPHLEQNLAQIYLDFVKEKLLSFNQIYFDPEIFQDPDDKEEYLYFVKSFLETSFKYLNYFSSSLDKSDLEYLKNDIKKFALKLKPYDDNWYLSKIQKQFFL